MTSHKNRPDKERSKPMEQDDTRSILNQLDTVLQRRKAADPEQSYVAQLYDKGLNKILEKVGEEATEVILAAKDLDQSSDAETNQAAKKEALAKEVADLWFHSLIALSYFSMDSTAIIKVLSERFGLSGIVEKASRSN